MYDQIAELCRLFIPGSWGLASICDADVGPAGCFDTAEDTVRLRMDEAVWRIAVHAGEANALEYIGWDVGDQRGFDAVGLALGDNRVDLHLAPASLCTRAWRQRVGVVL